MGLILVTRTRRAIEPRGGVARVGGVKVAQERMAVLVPGEHDFDRVEPRRAAHKDGQGFRPGQKEIAFGRPEMGRMDRNGSWTE